MVGVTLQKHVGQLKTVVLLNGTSARIVRLRGNTPKQYPDVMNHSPTLLPFLKDVSSI